jgi:hypothetical protein
MKNFLELTRKLLYLRMSAEETLNGKHGLTILENQEQIGNSLQWRAMGWMQASHTLQLVSWAMKEHEKVCLNAIERGEVFLPEDESWWNDKAKEILAEVAAECLRTIYRGVESSSNPMTLMESIAKVEAYKKALEGLVGIGEATFTSVISVLDVFEGYERREAEREAVRLKRVVKVKAYKWSGQYVLDAVNHRGGVLRRIETKLTTKPEANKEGERWAAELREEQKTEETVDGCFNAPYISVEFM